MAAFIGGRQSVEMRKVGMRMTQQVTRGRIMMLDGTHLFPMEKPITTAAAVEASLRGHGTAEKQWLAADLRGARGAAQVSSLISAHAGVR